MFWAFCPISVCVYFILFLFLNDCFLVKEREKSVCGFGETERWRAPRKSWGRENHHNQSILHEKNLFPITKENGLDESYLLRGKCCIEWGEDNMI